MRLLTNYLRQRSANKRKDSQIALSPDQLERHKRHIMLKEIGGPGVKKLMATRVSLIGAGALGGPCVLYLAAAGVGTIDIYDDDRIDRSNLQRQIQFEDRNIGIHKAESLAARLIALNPDINARPHVTRFIGSENIDSNIIIDATDNYETRYAINALAHTKCIPMVHGAAAGWSGQISVFASGSHKDAPCYQCWVPETPPDAQGCDEVGVVGAVTGIVGTQMALEAIKLITGAGTPLIGRLTLVDALNSTQRTLALNKDPACQTCAC